MPVSAATLRALAAAGATPDMLVAAVEAAEREDEILAQRRREEAAERQRRSRQARKVTSVTVTERDGCDTPPRAHVEDISSTKEDTGKKNKKGASRDELRAHLKTVLDLERVEAVIDHRQKIRAPMTPHAAKLLARDLAKASDPNAAADKMISKGWRGYDPAWDVERRNGHDPPRQSMSSKLMTALNHPIEILQDEFARRN